MKAKNVILFACVAALQSAVPALAQDTVSVHWTDNALVLRYQLQPLHLQSDYSYAVTPLLCSTNDTIHLKSQIWRGRRNLKKLKRAVLFGQSVANADSLKAGFTQPSMRHEVLPYASYPELRHGCWTLLLQREKEGCCNIEQLPAKSLGKFAYVPAFVPVLPEVPDFRGRAGCLEKDNPVLHHISKCRDYTPDRVLRKEKGALFIHFELNSADLKTDFRDNKKVLEKVVEITREIFADTTSQVVQIQIIGLASPEGSVKRNLWLGANRGKALQRYIQSKVPQAVDDLFYVVNGGEAWTELKDQIADSDLEERDELIRIIDTEKDLERREHLLKTLHGGKAYDILRNSMLKDQRNSGYISICYDYKADYNADVINRGIAMIRARKYAEAVALLRTVEADSRSHNALGVALWLNGERLEAKRLLCPLAEKGNPDAVENLRRWKAIESAEALNENAVRSGKLD